MTKWLVRVGGRMRSVEYTVSGESDSPPNVKMWQMHHRRGWALSIVLDDLPPKDQKKLVADNTLNTSNTPN